MGGFFSGVGGKAGAKIGSRLNQLIAGRKQASRDQSSPPSKSSGSNTDDPGTPSYHKGGVVRKTGLARLQKGERVLTKQQTKGLFSLKPGDSNRKRMRGK